MGRSAHGLQNGYSQLAGGVEKVHSDLQHQRSIIQSLVEAKNMYKNELGQLKTNLQRYLEERAQETPAVKAIVDNSIQKKTTLRARMETC